MRVLVIGAGPAGVLATLRPADLGAQTALVTSGAFGGMAANDGPTKLEKEGEPPMSTATITDRSVETNGESNRLTELRREVESSGNVARLRSEERRE